MKRTELVEHIFEKGTFLCVGLDPDIKKLPACITGSDGERVATFCKVIVDATAPYCVAYKPNLAFFESLGADGIPASPKPWATYALTTPTSLSSPTPSAAT